MEVEARGKTYNIVNADFIPRTVIKKMVRSPNHDMLSSSSDTFFSKYQRIGIILYMPLSAYQAADWYF
jgi:hypothetical protein